MYYSDEMFDEDEDPSEYEDYHGAMPWSRKKEREFYELADIRHDLDAEEGRYGTEEKPDTIREQ